jgi:hypothetical protein
MLVALAEVSLGDRDLAMGAVTKLDSSIAAGKVGADQLLTVFDVFGNDKVSGLTQAWR